MSNEKVLGSGTGPEGGSTPQVGSGSLQGGGVLAPVPSQESTKVDLSKINLAGNYIIQTEAGLFLELIASSPTEARSIFYAMSTVAGWDVFSPLTKLTVLSEDGFTDLLMLAKEEFPGQDKIAFITPEMIDGEDHPIANSNMKQYRVEWQASGEHEFMAESTEQAKTMLDGLLDPNDGNPLPHLFIPTFVEAVLAEIGGDFHEHLDWELDMDEDLEEDETPFLGEDEDE
jgi:hypothetical protein